MLHDRIFRYYQSLEEEFHLLYTDLLVETDKKHLHALRLNAKKQLAFSRLISFFDAGFQLNYVRKPFRQFLKITGPFRDSNVTLALADTLTGLSKNKAAYLEHLKQEELYHTALMKQKLEKFSLLRARASSEVILEEVRRLEGRVDIWVVLNNYFTAQLDVIRQLAVGVLMANDLHELHRLRVQVKEMLLNLQVLQHLTPRKLRLKKLYRHFDYLQDLLGEWHDRSLFLKKIHLEQKTGTKTLERGLKKSKATFEDRIFFLLRSFPLVHAFSQKVFLEIFTHP